MLELDCIEWHTALSDYPYTIGAILLRDETIVNILTSLEYELTVSDLINRFGPPDKIRISQTPDQKCYHTDLLWLSRGLGAELELSDASRIDMEQSVGGVNYFEPTSTVEDYLVVAVGLPRSEAIYQASEFMNWNP